jgi:hypothetical protein
VSEMGQCLRRFVGAHSRPLVFDEFVDRHLAPTLPIFSRGGQLKEITDDQLLDAVYDILQINLRLLKNGSLEHEDHEAYFKQHVAILKELMGRDKVVEPGGIAQSPDGKE